MALFQRARKILISNEPKPSHQILRAIEFEQEYFLAGLTIISYFGTVLRNRIPESNAKVRIEQDNLKITLIIETSEGQEEKIERFLNDYTLAVVGQKRLEEVTQTQEQLIELRQQLRLAYTQIECQRDILSCKDAEIERLNTLLSQSLETNSVKVINFNNSDKESGKKAKFSFTDFLSWAQNGQILLTLSSCIIGIIVFFLYPKLYPLGVPNIGKLPRDSPVSESDTEIEPPKPEVIPDDSSSPRSPSSNHQERDFFCDLSNNKPTTVAITTRGNMSLIIWQDEYESNFFGKTPEERCILTSGKLQAFYNADLLKYLTVDLIENNNVICAVKEISDICSIGDVLMPVSPNSDPKEVLDKLMKVRDNFRSILLKN